MIILNRRPCLGYYLISILSLSCSNKGNKAFVSPEPNNLFSRVGKGFLANIFCRPNAIRYLSPFRTLICGFSHPRFLARELQCSAAMVMVLCAVAWTVLRCCRCPLTRSQTLPKPPQAPTHGFLTPLIASPRMPSTYPHRLRGGFVWYQGPFYGVVDAL